MTDFYKNVSNIKKYAEAGDEKALCSCISQYRTATGECVDHVVYELLIIILTDHPELLEGSSELYEAWTEAIKTGETGLFGTSRSFLSIRNDSLRCVINNDKSVTSMLKLAEEYCLGSNKKWNGEDSERELFCKTVILAAHIFDNCEVLEYEAYRYAEKPEMYLPRNSVWLLIRCLMDREMYSALDRLYEGCFNSDLSALVGCCNSDECWDIDNVSYLKMLYRRYVTNGRIVREENEHICELIAGAGSEYIVSCIMMGMFANQYGIFRSPNSTNMRELEKLAEIGYKTNDLSVLIRALYPNNHILYEPISKIIGESPFIYIDELARTDISNDVIGQLILEHNVSISLDNHGKSDIIMLYDEIFKERWLKKLPRHMPFRMTDPAGENDYLTHAIYSKAGGFEYVFGRLDFSTEQLTELVDMCIKSSNLKALNIVRKRLDEKLRERSGK